MQNIVQPLLAWYAQNARDLPWRRDREPYHVWLSEIMLQQTRVEAARGYYLRFIAALPTLEALAACEEERLLKLWEGLGYYRRARNLHAAARVVMREHGGVFPDTYPAIRALPGIGDYTAGAIASICFEAPTPALDGNVLRIMARLHNCAESVDLPPVRKRFRAALAGVYPPGSCGAFTQALMELGACVCTPRSPACDACPLKALCLANALHTQRTLPVRRAKAPRRQETRTVFRLCCDAGTALQKRSATGLLAGLWELPGVPGALGAGAALEQVRAWGLTPVNIEKTLRHTHVFTHVAWHMTCHVIRCAGPGGGFTWASDAELRERYALPSAFRPFMLD